MSLEIGAFGLLAATLAVRLSGGLEDVDVEGLGVSRGKMSRGGRRGNALPACCGRLGGAGTVRTVSAVCGLIHWLGVTRLQRQCVSIC
jgi:hypothetical protein